MARKEQFTKEYIINGGIEFVKWLSRETIDKLIENKEFRESNISGYKSIIEGE